MVKHACSLLVALSAAACGSSVTRPGGGEVPTFQPGGYTATILREGSRSSLLLAGRLRAPSSTITLHANPDAGGGSLVVTMVDDEGSLLEAVASLPTSEGDTVRAEGQLLWSEAAGTAIGFPAAELRAEGMPDPIAQLTKFERITMQIDR